MTAKIIRTVSEMQSMAETLRQSGKVIGAVPTMGYLHDGHLSLIRLAHSVSDSVVTTLFVNPTQFGPGEDFERYPRDHERDVRLAGDAGSEYLFIPEAREMYPEGYRTYVTAEELSDVLEGKFRPGHFRGVTTIVAKLFHIVKPHLAVFGQKDAQQVAVIRQMVRDLNMDVRIVVAPIVREPDGLALSSRNTYLSTEERRKAVAVFRALSHARGLAAAGERRADTVREGMMAILREASPAAVDYIAFVEKESFREMQRLEPPEALVLVAARFGKTRLIDNMLIPVPSEAAS